ncbi:MAG: hypothetical protein ACHBN1_02465 [Heteroscytonema crispum UTEX LB 1556]
MAEGEENFSSAKKSLKPQIATLSSESEKQATGRFAIYLWGFPSFLLLPTSAFSHFIASPKRKSSEEKTVL